MSTFEVVGNCGVTKEVDTRQEAEDAQDAHAALCDECDEDAEINPVTDDDEAKTDGGEVQTGEVVDQQPGPGRDDEDLPAQEDRSVDQDPFDIVPGYMLDEVQGEPSMNKRGYTVIANQYDISVTSEPITLASESSFEHAEFTATAVDTDGREYSGHGTAHVDRGDDVGVLNEMAETRAMKRAVAWASGMGINAYQELMGMMGEDDG